MTQTDSAIIVGIKPLDGICQPVHGYAPGQRPLFGITERRESRADHTYLLCRERPCRTPFAGHTEGDSVSVSVTFSITQCD
jgi:hypothetical protein